MITEADGFVIGIALTTGFILCLLWRLDRRALRRRHAGQLAAHSRACEAAVHASEAALLAGSSLAEQQVATITTAAQVQERTFWQGHLDAWQVALWMVGNEHRIYACWLRQLEAFADQQPLSITPAGNLSEPIGRLGLEELTRAAHLEFVEGYYPYVAVFHIIPVCYTLATQFVTHAVPPQYRCYVNVTLPYGPLRWT
jgi:hypothetical protein